MKMPVEYVIGKFLRTYREPFTLEEFSEILKEINFMSSEAESLELLRSFNCVFELEGKRFITRAGAFSGYYFSFKPTQEELDQGVFIAGHRCMPFVDPEIISSALNFTYNDKRLKRKVCEFGAGLLLDLFSLYGDEYSSQVIASDPANYKLKLSETDFNLPPVTQMTCFDISEMIEECDFSYGDRLLCFVDDWNENRIVVMPMKANHDKSMIDPLDLERENWFSELEGALLNDFETIGPCDSMESQLAFTFINNFSKFSVTGCGSVEELLQRTKKISFEPYGVESRLWKKGAEIPVIGKWNEDEVNSVENCEDQIIQMTENDIAPDFVADAYLKNCLFVKSLDYDDLQHSIYPNYNLFSQNLRDQILLHLKNRHDILSKTYNYFADYRTGTVRKKVVELFSKVNALSIRIGIECNDVSKLPSQELVVLGQLHQQLMRFLECFQFDDIDTGTTLDDIQISVDNMALSFDVISEDLNRVVNIESKKGFKVIKSYDKGEV